MLADPIFSLVLIHLIRLFYFTILVTMEFSTIIISASDGASCFSVKFANLIGSKLVAIVLYPFNYARIFFRASLNAKINASIVQLVATTTAGTWMNFNVPSLAQYRYIIFCINDGNMSQFPPVIYPISVFKTCNSINRTAMLSEYGTIKCYACYNNDTQIGLYIGGSERQITVYGIQ